MPRRTTPATPLDHFKTEARRWLKALRAGDPEARARLERAWPGAPAEPGLREVQHALARERGRESWAELKRSLPAAAPAPPWRDLTAEDYAGLAADWVAAHDRRDAAAFARLNARYGRAAGLEDLDAEIWRRVYAYRQRSSEAGPRRLLPTEAETLVAQDAGVGSWAQLMAAQGAPRTPAYALDARRGRISPRRRLGDAEWDGLIETMKARGIAALDANGLMTDAVLARVAELEQVTHLTLGGSRELTDEGLHQLAGMPQLESLSLSEAGGKLTDKALEVLAGLPKLRRFEMAWQRGITDAGVARLAACERLEHVDLMGTLTGDGAIAALAGKPQLRSLRTGRLVTDAGLRRLRDFPRFAAWSGEPAAADSDDIAGAAGSLHIDGPFTDAGVASLGGLDGVYELNLFWHATEITSAAFASLKALPNLGALGADGALIDDAAMAHIAALPRLRRLRAQETIATDAGFEALGRSATLEYLWTRDAGPGARGFVALSQAPALRRLGVNLQGLDDATLAVLSRFPELRELIPIGATDASFRHIGRCERLERLTCMYCRQTGDAATAHVADLNLRRYYAGLTRITDASLEILGRMSSLEVAEFYETKGVTDPGLAHLARAPRLREVALEHLPGVTARGVRVFAPQVEVTYAP